MKPGDVLELGIWMDGTETQELKDRFEGDLKRSFKRSAKLADVVISPVTMIVSKPGDDRVPKVPEGLHGPDVRFLIGEAEVVNLVPSFEGYFVADLEPKDLERLRTILRRVYQEYNPGKPELSTEKCDEFINQNGPDAALEALREQVGIKVH